MTTKNSRNTESAAMKLEACIVNAMKTDKEGSIRYADVRKGMNDEFANIMDIG